MMFLLLLTTLFSLFHSLFSQALDANGVSLEQKMEAMEVILLTPGTINFPVTPCNFSLNMDPHFGEQTSAEWVRIVFHDFVTANVSAGTG